MTQQTYEIADTFGKSPEELQTLQKTMIQDLASFDVEIITDAFARFRKQFDTVPTVKKIYALCEQAVVDRNRHAQLASTPPARALPKPETQKVPWVGLYWNQFTDGHKLQLARHCRQMGWKKAKEYMKFLQHHAGFPPNGLELIGVDFSNEVSAESI